MSIEYPQHNVRNDDLFLYHKTTHRGVYEQALEGATTRDVILWNERGVVTESTTANNVAEINGKMLTPIVECGLLSGTFRGHLLEAGEIEERRLTREDLTSATRLFLINSVRRWMPVTLTASVIRDCR